MPRQRYQVNNLIIVTRDHDLCITAGMIVRRSAAEDLVDAVRRIDGLLPLLLGERHISARACCVAWTEPHGATHMRCVDLSSLYTTLLRLTFSSAICHSCRHPYKRVSVCRGTAVRTCRAPEHSILLHIRCLCHGFLSLHKMCLCRQERTGAGGTHACAPAAGAKRG